MPDPPTNNVPLAVDRPRFSERKARVILNDLVQVIFLMAWVLIKKRVRRSGGIVKGGTDDLSKVVDVRWRAQDTVTR
ncbi:MAG: hypothetical protein L0Z50_12505 [Verrucomicrobiales bacterium]|nr:hypothetical protein [Verrucomicrobiales bacterium]